jgi:hypothetical protein
MSSCIIYAYDNNIEKKYKVGNIQKHYQMSDWLNNNGIKNYIYEIHKGDTIHSKWIWKENQERWGRTATPSKKRIIIISDDEKNIKNDRITRKKIRQEKSKFQSTKDRHN